MKVAQVLASSVHLLRHTAAGCKPAGHTDRRLRIPDGDNHDCHEESGSTVGEVEDSQTYGFLRSIDAHRLLRTPPSRSFLDLVLLGPAGMYGRPLAQNCSAFADLALVMQSRCGFHDKESGAKLDLVYDYTGRVGVERRDCRTC